MGKPKQLNDFSTWDLGVRDIFFPNEFALQLTCGISTKEFPEDEIKLILKKGPMILIDDVFFCHELSMFTFTWRNHPI